jgi:ArsR family transcriptional regulator
MGRATIAAELPQLFAALADPTRLRLLNLMNGREVCVCHFVEILKQGQPKISRHLAYLRRAGVVSARRDGRWMHYRIEWPRDAAASTVLETALRSLKADKRMQAEAAGLERRSCDAPGLVSLNGAPNPVDHMATKSLRAFR